MPYPASLVGRSTDPVRHDVDARWTMAYAAGIGASSPRYFDTRAEIVAHPVFPVCLEWPAVLAARMLDPTGSLDRSELLRGVHATHDLTIHRPIVPDERLTTTATVVAVEARKPGTYEVLRLDTTDDAGEPVVTTHMGSLFLGVDLEGPETPAAAAVPAIPDVDRGSSSGRWLPIAPQAAHVYTECARIHNPIHTDEAVALAAGLPGPILHGTATLAMAVSDVVHGRSGGDPAAVVRLGCRFGAMVPLPDEITVIVGAETGSDDPPKQRIGFSVLNGAGQYAITNGWVDLGQ